VSFVVENQLLFASYVAGNREFVTGYFQQRLDRAKAHVNSLSKDQFLNTSEETLVEHELNRCAVEPLQVFQESMEMEELETQIDVRNRSDRYFPSSYHSGPVFVPGIRVVVSLPFTGDPDLWKYTPTTFTTTFPRGTIRTRGPHNAGVVEITLEAPSDDPPERLRRPLDSVLSGIDVYIERQRKDVEVFNSELPSKPRGIVAARRERIRQNDGLVASLGIPLKRRDGVPEIRPVEISRRLVRPLPPPPQSGFKPEPGMSTEDYEHILSVIRHEGATFESTPSTYAVHDEEELRDILLAHLNGHYERGAAAGEAFRKRGKTDIRIEEEDRAAFVAECAVWSGPAGLSEKLDQLLGYLTWRDCKTSLVIFNKHNKGFSGIQTKIPSTLEEHANFLRTVSADHDGEWRFQFRSLDDEAREITVHVFAFDLYCED